MNASQDVLDSFYVAIGKGVSVGALLSRYRAVIECACELGLMHELRLGSGKFKKFQDEVVPVVRFVQQFANLKDTVRFSLGDAFPDAVLTHSDGRVRQIEVTVAQASTRLFTMLELNEKGTARGYLNLPDNAPIESFRASMAQERVAYTTEEILGCVDQALANCIEKKKVRGGDTLLVEILNIEILPADRLLEHIGVLSIIARDAEFGEVFITCSSTSGNICLRVK